MMNKVDIKLGGVWLEVSYTIDAPYDAQDIYIESMMLPGSTVDITDALHDVVTASAYNSGAAQAVAESRNISYLQGLVMAAAEKQAARAAADALADLAGDL